MRYDYNHNQCPYAFKSKSRLSNHLCCTFSCRDMTIRIGTCNNRTWVPKLTAMNCIKWAHSLTLTPTPPRSPSTALPNIPTFCSNQDSIHSNQELDPYTNKNPHWTRSRSNQKVKRTLFHQNCPVTPPCITNNQMSGHKHIPPTIHLFSAPKQQKSHRLFLHLDCPFVAYWC